MDSEQVRRRNLPHWDVPNATYFVTTCLKGSISAQGLLDIARYRREIQIRPAPKDMSPDDWRVQCWKLNFARLDHWLDKSDGISTLQDPRLAQIVVDAMRYFAEERYELLGYVIMPSHYHWVFQPQEDWIKNLGDDDRSPRERIMYSLNRFTSNQCNKLIERKGSFWQNESYDHWIRDVDELDRILRYIEENPVKAGLVDQPEKWQFSSAWLRKALGLEWGVPFPQDMYGTGRK
jgi:type I restriction enzyme R subunit